MALIELPTGCHQLSLLVQGACQIKCKEHFLPFNPIAVAKRA